MESKEFYDFLIKVQSIAKIGLKYSKDPYAIDNYNQINELTKEMLEKFLEVKFDRPNFFIRDIYPTPSITTRTVILNEKNEILLVKESKEENYSLPGGWCDLYDSPSVASKNEVSQEAGKEIELVRLVGVLNRTPFLFDTSIPEYVIFFLANITKDLNTHTYETSDVAFFPLDHLPLMSHKTSHHELSRILEAIKNGETIFD